MQYTHTKINLLCSLHLFIHSNTDDMFPGDNSFNPSSRGIPYLTAGGIVLTEFLLSSTWLPFGVFYIELVKLGAVSVNEGLWIPIIIVSVRSISSPPTRKLCEYLYDNDYDNHRQISAVTILTAALAIILAACRICSSLVSNQLKEVTYEDFQSKPLLFEGLQQLAKAISLFFMPHIFYYLVQHYTVYEAEFLFAAVLLHAIPICFVVKTKQYSSKSNLSRYKTLPTLHNQEIAIVPTISPPPDNDASTVEDSFSDSSSEEEEEEFCVTELEAKKDGEPVVQAVVPVYCKNFMGVDILPEIPEEDEPETEEEKLENRQRETMKDSIRRFSQLSAKFEDLISSELKNNEYHSAISNVESGVQELQFDVAKKRSTIRARWRNFNCCSPYQKYLYRKRLDRTTDIFFSYFIKPLWRCLRNVSFYPCLITKVVLTITSMIYIIFIPYVAITSEHEYLPHVVSAESTMLLSLMAFPWLCFLVFLPWLINFSKSKLKAIFSLGILILGLSTFLTNLQVNYDIIAISSLMFGTSYAGTELSQEIIFREVVGIRQWRNIRDPLEITAGLLTLCVYSVIYALDVNLLAVLGGNAIVCILIASIWLFIFLKNVVRINIIVGL